jgi:hypothetical protein
MKSKVARNIQNYRFRQPKEEIISLCKFSIFFKNALVAISINKYSQFIMVMINNLFCSERKTIQVRYSTRRGFRDVVLLDIMPAIGYNK